MNEENTELQDAPEVEVVEEEAEVVAEEENKSELTDRTQKAINRKHFQMKEAERQREAAELKAKELEAKLASYQEKSTVVPEMPDPYEDDYEQLIVERDKALERQAEQRYQQKIQQEQQLRTQQQQQAEFDRELVSKTEQYAAKAKDYGIKPEDLQIAGNEVSQYGIRDDVAMGIIDREDGSLITTYLAKNLLEIDKLNSMTPFQAGAYIDNKLSVEASKLKPKSSKTPPPPTDVSGSGVDLNAGTYPLTKAATFS